MSRGTQRIRTLVATLAGVCALALAGGAASADSPPTITDDLDDGPQGWELYLTSGERELDWYPSDGSPGGYVSAEVDDPASEDAAFGDAGYVSDMSRYAGSKIAFELRSSLETGERPTVWLYDYGYDPDYEGEAEGLRLLHARAQGPAVGKEWTGYLLPLEATNETRWFDEGGERASKQEFDAVLESDPSFIIGADLSDQPGERTDLDNPGIIVDVDRTVSLRYAARRDRFTGRVGSPDLPECSSDQNVQIFKRVAGGTRVFAQAQTNTAGNYSATKRARPGRYFARVAASNSSIGSECREARSKTIRVR